MSDSRFLLFRPWLAALCPAILFALGAFAPGQDATPARSKNNGLTAEQQKKIEERDRLSQQVEQLRQAGKFREAIAGAEQILATNRTVFGEVTVEVVESLVLLARFHELLDEWDRAEARLRHQLKVKEQLYPEQPWRVRDAQLDLAELLQRKQLDPAARKTLQDAAGRSSLVNQLLRRQPEQAVAMARQVVSKYEQTVGKKHRSYADGVFSLAQAHQSLNRTEEAERRFKEAGNVRKGLFGEEHPAYAMTLINLAMICESTGRYPEAEGYLIRARDIWERVLGKDHPSYASILGHLGTVYTAMGAHSRAQPLLERVHDLTKGRRGKADYGVSLVNLAQLYQSMGKYDLAESKLVEARGILKATLTESHPHYATCLDILGRLYVSMGQFDVAEPLLEEAHDLRKSKPRDQAAYAASVHNLAFLYASTGSYSRAEPRFLQAHELLLKAVGRNHPDYATSLHNLAAFYYSFGKYDEAEERYVESRELREMNRGKDSPEYLRTLNNLASVYAAKGENAKAEALLVDVRDLSKKTHGPDHPSYPTSLHNLATFFQARGDFEQAEEMLLQARDIRGRVLGTSHPHYVATLHNLTTLYYGWGKYDTAESFARERLEVRLSLAETVLPSLAETRAMRFLQEHSISPDPWLSVLAQIKNPPVRDAYSAIWRSHGLISRTIRAQRKSTTDSAEAQPLLDELRFTQERLAQLTLATTGPAHRERRRQRLATLDARKEELETKLARISADFRRRKTTIEASVSDLAKLLPTGVAIVHFVKTQRWNPRQQGQPRITSLARYQAFVLRGQNEAEPLVSWVDLGPSAPIERAVTGWRKQIREDRVQSRTADASAPWPQQLRSLVWSRVETHLADCRTVVVIPAGDLHFVCWGALPGKAPGKYLIEDYAIALAESGQQICAQLTSPPIEGNQSLLVGGVQYDDRAAPVAQARSRAPAGATDGDRPQWEFLSGALTEVKSVAKLGGRGGRLKELRGKQATESALRRLMPESRFVHLATHGFFADEEFRAAFGHDTKGEVLSTPIGNQQLITRDLSAVTRRNPLLLSGIVLAGANLPAITNRLGLPTGQDGILTAEEVANLDLRGTELVVLSACETRVGRVGGGEGVYGLHRAFGLAGARTVIASLWKVDDAATEALMVEFYRNLWNRKLGRLKSLREAQLTMLQRFDPQKNALVRGDIRRVDKPVVKLKGGTRLPPYYWAAFTLSGDWR